MQHYLAPSERGDDSDVQPATQTTTTTVVHFHLRSFGLFHSSLAQWTRFSSRNGLRRSKKQDSGHGSCAQRGGVQRALPVGSIQKRYPADLAENREQHETKREIEEFIIKTS